MNPTMLPAGLEEPGIYVVVTADSDPGISKPTQTALIWGYMTAGYPGQADAPELGLSQLQVDSDFGPDSMIAQRYAAAKAQLPLGAEFWLIALAEPSGGTASVVTVEFTGEPTAGVLSSGTAATAADTVWVGLRGRGVRVDFKKDDDFATIATAVKAAWDAMPRKPASCTRVGAALSFTAPHKGAFDNGAMEVTFASKGASGVAALCGTFTVGGVTGTAGSFKFTLGKYTPTIAVTALDTTTTAATKIVTALNGSAYPVRVAQPSVATGVVSVFYVSGRPIRPLDFSSTETTTALTVADAFGTKGVGVPTLTTALVNLAAFDMTLKAWAPFWKTTSEASALASHIEAQALAPMQKGQMAVFATVETVAAISASNLPASTSPRLDSSWRYPVLAAQCAPNAEWELNVRLCAAIAGEQQQGRTNWNGFQFVGDEDAPIVPTHPADRLTVPERNLLIATYRLAPVTVNSQGRMAVTWGGNSYKPRGFKDAALRKISAQLSVDFMRYDLRNYLESRFGSSSPTGAKQMKVAGEPRTDSVTTPGEVRKECYAWAVGLDNADLFDGAAAKKDAFAASVIVSPNRIDVAVPFCPLKDIDIIAPTATIVS